MIKRNVSFLAFKRRLDRWLLVRAPLLWRTRLPHLLVLLILAVTAVTIPFIQTRAIDPTEAYGAGSTTYAGWVLELFGVVCVLLLWVRSIIRKPVGELAPHRHVVTVVAVAIGSYLWLITPSLLAYPQINAIAQIRLSDQELKTDLAFVSQYSYWTCVPSDVWNNESELKQLHDVFLRYFAQANVKKGPANEECSIKEAFNLDQTYLVKMCKEAISNIIDARSFGSNYTAENGFYGIWIGHSWWLVAALATGILTAILSYPRYVWRRFLRR
jgi:hypothetical protein